VFTKIAQDHADGVVMPAGSTMMFNERARIGAAAISHKLPGVCQSAEVVPHGLLMSYGQDFPDFFAAPQPALGIGFPQSLILSADEMIGGA
jgi:putative ABC transport system substrate-binding protein